MKKILLLAAAATLVVSAICGCMSNTTVEAYTNPAILHGQGGAVKTVHGIDFYSEGAPARNYRIVGVITDKRVDGPLVMMTRNKTIIERVRAMHGDAVILAGQEEQPSGAFSSGSVYGGHGYYSGSGFAAIQNSVTVRYHVIQYVK